MHEQQVSIRNLRSSKMFRLATSECSLVLLLSLNLGGCSESSNAATVASGGSALHQQAMTGGLGTSPSSLSQAGGLRATGGATTMMSGENGGTISSSTVAVTGTTTSTENSTGGIGGWPATTSSSTGIGGSTASTTSTGGIGGTATTSAPTINGGAGGASATSTATSGELLSETGLYESDMKTLRSGVVPYTPRFELWSDGATKRRWLYLPPGTVIDTQDPDYWQFPVGTKVWKEFSKGGKRVETRIVERVSSRVYRMVAYLWKEDLSDAIAVPDGQKAALGTDHDVPSSTDCDTCHLNQPGRFIGLGALQLDYDTAELSVDRLWAEGKLSQPVPPAKQLPGDATAQAAIGILHANCGACHNPSSTLPYKALDLWQRVGLLADITQTPVYQSAVGIAGGKSESQIPTLLISPGHPEQSAIIFRMASREAKIAMPPLASKVVDSEAVTTVSEFIANLQ